MSTKNRWANIDSITFTEVLKNSINFESHYKIVPTEGYLAWEYNPLRNYRLSEIMYEKDGKYYTKEDVGLTQIQTEILKHQNQINLLKEQLKTVPTEERKTILNEIKKLAQNIDNLQTALDDIYNNYILLEPGELVDFITDGLSFNLNHPVEILPQYSYDGSVNLILNDGLNIPRLINSRFTVTGKNTYKIIDRKGDNDTNIYDQGEQFDVDTSLFKSVNKIPQLKYLGTSSGNMSIGNYHFYFKYSDTDGNETDWVAESGLVSIFMGYSPQSYNTGIRDENSLKSVRFKLSNIDLGYTYVKVYYTRYSAEIDANLVVEAKRIDKNFIINSQGVCNILITGDENTTEVTLEEINSSFDVIQNAQTQCSASNRLFMANIHKSKIEYDMLAKLSLCFCPYKSEKPYPLSDGAIDYQYNITGTSRGYYDSEFIYEYTGYWPGELYRLGIVYILKDGSLSPVFNIRGATNICTKKEGSWYYKVDKDFNTQDSNNKPVLQDILKDIKYSEEDFLIIGGTADNENAKGVIQLSNDYDSGETFPIYGINITADAQVIEELKKYARGFFFVRQKRIPLTLAQGIIIGMDKESRTPTIPTIGGIINEIDYENSFLETANINDINFISEGFLSLYKYNLEEKPSERWKRFGKFIGAIVAVAALVIASVFTCGAAMAAAAGTALALTSAMTTALVVTGVVGTTLIVGATSFTLSQERNSHINARTERSKMEGKPLPGRYDKIPDGFERKESDESRQITNDYINRLIIKDPSKNIQDAMIVPDYQVNQPYYNQLLTGDKFTLYPSYEQPITNYATDGYFDNDYRHFYVSSYTLYNVRRKYDVNLVGVPDGCPVKMINQKTYRARAGYPEEAYKYEFVGQKFTESVDKRDNNDIIRGNYGSFVGIDGYTGHATDQVNIMIPGYQENKLFEYVQLRAQDNSAFYAISDRISLNYEVDETTLLQQTQNSTPNFAQVLYRGDCYICQYTHRIVRNFNDPSAPYNDVIVDPNSWKDNYDPDKPENYANINLGDVNAVPLGMWLTFQLRSSYNLNIRTIDKSHVDEYIMSGNYRSFYPNYGQLALGAQKLPDSDQYNKGFTKSVSEKYYFEVPDVPYIKQEFQNRIVFSDIHINDAYKNGFRVLRTMNHKDYPMTYGSITKLIEMQNNLIVIFEHGIGLIKINNSVEHSSQVLSDLIVISDTYGSQWKDSIIKTPGGIYGVDTVAKKIWFVKNQQLLLISDLKVQEFLNQNITLSERELTPIMGIRNVKTVYNAFKHDVMFTFYDNLYGSHEKSWNLCWNEALGIFTTFYSWIPSDMQNIDNIPFSFDRSTVKAISKLGVSDHNNDFSDGITLSNNVLYVSDDGFTVSDKSLQKTYYDQYGELKEFEFKEPYTKNEVPDGTIDLQTLLNDSNFIGFLYLDNRVTLDKKVQYKIQYELLRDNYKNYTMFEIKTVNVLVTPVKELLNDTNTDYIEISYLALKPQYKPQDLLSEIYYRNSEGNTYADVDTNKLDTSVKDANGNILKDPDGNIIKKIHIDKPIFKNSQGKRLTLPEELQVNPDKIVRYLNIKANVLVGDGTPKNSAEAYYNQFMDENSSMISAGYFESQVAITTSHNLSLLSTDFWKHGQAGIIDISDNIYPTYWYGRQHPFEFECIVVNDPSVHKIFTNLELVSNKVKPESFHYEVVGDVYDFAEDKPTMYFRQEALKALYQYNGYNIEYNPNFLDIESKQHNKSADLPKYYSRWDTINEIYDTYKQFAAPGGFNYDHLSGAEIVYYPTRNEFRVWNHAKAIDVDELDQDIATSVIKANCRYLEDKWLVSINPIVVTYKNEVDKVAAAIDGLSMFTKNSLGVYKYSTWADRYGKPGSKSLPPINIHGTKLEETLKGNIEFPGNNNSLDGKDNALYQLYDLQQWNKGEWRPIDPVKNIDRRETDVRGKFMKVRIRYSGKELAIIDFLNTIYQISYA